MKCLLIKGFSLLLSSFSLEFFRRLNYFQSHKMRGVHLLLLTLEFILAVPAHMTILIFKKGCSEITHFFISKWNAVFWLIWQAVASVVKVVERRGSRKACHPSLPAGSQRAMVSVESQGLKTGGATSVCVMWKNRDIVLFTSLYSIIHSSVTYTEKIHIKNRQIH